MNLRREIQTAIDLLNDPARLHNFFYQSNIMVDNYAQEEKLYSLEDKLYDDDFIAAADERLTRILITFCIRGEKFCAGYLDKSIKDGRLQMLLSRLDSLS